MDSRPFAPGRPATEYARVAREILIEEGMDSERASARLRRLIDTDEAYKNYIFNICLEDNIRNIIRKALDSHRRDSWLGYSSVHVKGVETPANPHQKKQSIEMVGADIAFSLMKYVLPNRVVLAAALRDDLLHAVNFYSDRVVFNRQRLSWLSQIYRELPEGKSVSEHFTENTLVDYQASAISAVSGANDLVA